MEEWMEYFQNQVKGNKYQDSRDFIKTTNSEEKIRKKEIKVAIGEMKKKEKQRRKIAYPIKHEYVGKKKYWKKCTSY